MKACPVVLARNRWQPLRAQKPLAPPAPVHFVFLLGLALLLLLLLLGLEVLVGEVGRGATNEHESVHADAEAGGIARRRRRDGTGLGGLGGRVSGLQKQLIVSR